MIDIDYKALIDNALNEPGRISKCYKAFYNFSLINSLIAERQLTAQNLPIAPIKTFKQWKEIGRNVKKGSKAISLRVPRFKKIIDKDTETGEETEDCIRYFILKNLWFSVDQTDGKDFNQETIKVSWNKEKALKILDIEEVVFNRIDGNAQGYAENRKFAINPCAIAPTKTTFHEIAHIILGHSEKVLNTDLFNIEKGIMEAEAELTSYLCRCALDSKEFLAESRGYIQMWLKNKKLPVNSYKKIVSAANKILEAGK